MDAQLADAWSTVAAAYADYFGPRFAPWIGDTLNALVARAEGLPPGPLAVLCCGPGDDAARLAARLPDRRVIGFDGAAGMIAEARRRHGETGALSWQTADVSDGSWAHEPMAGIVSCFGLQQMPDPPESLACWVRALAPGGLASVTYWPAESEEDGPFAAGKAVVARFRQRTRVPWEGGLAAAVAGAGGQLLEASGRAHPIDHPDAATCFEALVSAGPWRVLAETLTPNQLRALRDAFVAAAPPGPWRHHPKARHLLVERARRD